MAILSAWRALNKRDVLLSLFTATILLVVSLVINFYAGTYATKIASNAVTDLVLSNIRVMDVDSLFVYGTFLFWLFVSSLCFLAPGKIPFIFKSIALFVVTRAMFISLTHIGPYPTQLVIPSDFLGRFAFTGDLFFSGHTGLPFLFALLFWKNRPLRYIFLGSALFFGIVVLLGHLHYSIDVFAAFFITYSISHLADRLFVTDKKLFENTSFWKQENIAERKSTISRAFQPGI